MNTKTLNLLFIFCFTNFYSAFSQQSYETDSTIKSFSKGLKTESAQNLSPSLRLSDSLICAGEKIYITFTPNEDYFHYAFDLIDDTNGIITHLDYYSHSSNPPTPQRLVINTGVLEPITQTKIYRLKISVYNYGYILIETVIINQKLIVNPTPEISQAFRDNQTFDDITLGHFIPIKFTRLRGKLPFSYIIDDSLKVNMPVDTFTFMYERKRIDTNFKLDGLTDANGCTNQIDYYNHTGTYTDFQVFPQISLRRASAITNQDKLFCKGEIMEVRLKVGGVVPQTLKFIPKYRSVSNAHWQNLPVLLDSANLYLIQLPSDITSGRYILTFEPNDTNYSVDLGYEFEDIFEVVDRITGLIYSNGEIKINKNEGFSFKVAINDKGFSPESRNFYEVLLRTNFGDRIKLDMHAFDNYVNIDTLTRTTTFFLESIKFKGGNNQRFDFCESAILSGQVVVQVFDRKNKDINILNVSLLDNGCLNRKIRVEYTPIGIVSTSDLKIQLKAQYSTGIDESAFIDIPTTAISNNLLEGILPYDTLYHTYSVRIYSASNNLYGQKYYTSIFFIGSPPLFKINGEAFITASQTPSIYLINEKNNFEGDNFSVSFKSNGHTWNFSSVHFESKVEFSLPTTPDLVSLGSFTISPDGITGGNCQNNSFVGSVKVNIVQNSPIQISLVSRSIVCEAEKFYFNYNLGNVFRKTNDYNYKLKYVKVSDLSAIYTQTLLLYTQTGQSHGIYSKAVAPFEYDTDYYVYLVSEIPFAISEPILIHTAPKPNLGQIFDDASHELLDQGIVQLKLGFTYTPPFTIKYFDGDFSREYTTNSRIVYFRPYDNHSSTRSLDDYRYKFKIQSIKDANCINDGPFIYYIGDFVTLKKQAPIIIYPPNKLEVCQGNSVKFPFKKDRLVSNITLQFYHPTEHIFYDLNTVVGVDTITLVSMQNIPTEKPIYFRIKGVKDDQLVYSPSTHNFITFLSNSQTPTATLLTQKLAYNESIKDFNLKIDFTGSGPWKLDYSLNGQKESLTTDKNPFYFKLNTVDNTFSKVLVLNTVKNACGIGNANGRVDLIKASFDVFPEVNNFENFCHLSKVDFTIIGVGSFPNNTKLYFVSENLNKPDKVYEVPFVRKGGDIVEVTIPANLPSGADKANPRKYKIRAVCTSPTLEGQFFKTYDGQVVEVNIWGAKPFVKITGANTIVRGDSTNITISMDKYVDGTFVVLNNLMYEFTHKTHDIVVKPTKDTTFRLTSAINLFCGAEIGSPSEAKVIVRLCPLAISINSNVEAGIDKYYQAEKIEAINRVNSQSRVEYNGEKSIILKNGFESKQGSIFKAQIRPCINSPNP